MIPCPSTGGWPSNAGRPYPTTQARGRTRWWTPPPLSCDPPEPEDVLPSIVRMLPPSTPVTTATCWMRLVLSLGKSKNATSPGWGCVDHRPAILNPSAIDGVHADSEGSRRFTSLAQATM
jgi:hypothetical protein